MRYGMNHVNRNTYVKINKAHYTIEKGLCINCAFSRNKVCDDSTIPCKDIMRSLKGDMWYNYIFVKTSGIIDTGVNQPEGLITYKKD